MIKLKQFAVAKPILFGLALIVAYALLSTLIYPVHFLFPDNDVGQVYGDAVTKLLISAVFILLLWRFGWLERSGLTRLAQRRGRLLIAGLATYLLFGEIYAFTGDMSPAVASTLMGIAQFPGTLPGALLEELLYRALLLTAMLLAWGHTKRGVIKSVVLSSFLFGATHLVNIMLRPIGVVVLQAILVSLPGVLYAALLLKSGSLWPAIVIHWLTNAAVNIKVVGLENYQETNVMWLRFALLLIPTTAYSAYVLWKLPIVKAEESSTQNRPPIGTVEPTESII